MRRFLLIATASLGLSACAAESVWAPDDVIARYHYADHSTPSLTLYSVIKVETGAGGHTALLVNAPSERVLFDPSGSISHPRMPERNDVIYGMTDAAVAFFTDYHSRTSWEVVTQEIKVSPEVAEQALALVKANGAVPNAYCASSTVAILRQLQGFEGLKSTMFPDRLMDDFATLPGVETRRYHDNDPDNNGSVVAHGV